MSVYFVFCTKNNPQNLNIVLSHGTVTLQQLSEQFIPEFHVGMPNKYFYFLDGEINFKRLTETPETCSIEDKFNRRFQEERNELFQAVLRWLSVEVMSGNSIYLIRQIETNSRDERATFNTVYACQPFALSTIFNDPDEVKYDFNIAYEILE